MPTRKLTADERTSFRAKYVDTKRKRGIAELKREMWSVVQHLRNTGRSDLAELAEIVSMLRNHIGRADFDAELATQAWLFRVRLQRRALHEHTGVIDLAVERARRSKQGESE